MAARSPPPSASFTTQPAEPQRRGLPQRPHRCPAGEHSAGPESPPLHPGGPCPGHLLPLALCSPWAARVLRLTLSLSLPFSCGRTFVAPGRTTFKAFQPTWVPAPVPRTGLPSARVLVWQFTPSGTSFTALWLEVPLLHDHPPCFVQTQLPASLGGSPLYPQSDSSASVFSRLRQPCAGPQTCFCSWLAVATQVFVGRPKCSHTGAKKNFESLSLATLINYGKSGSRAPRSGLPLDGTRAAFGCSPQGQVRRGEGLFRGRSTRAPWLLDTGLECCVW